MKSSNILRNYQSIFFLVIFMNILVSCSNIHNNFEAYKEIDKQEWSLDDTVLFRVPISDTTNSYDVYINLRHDGTYPYSNIFYFLGFSAPNGVIVQDTLEYYLTDSKGQWVGKGWGSIWSHKLPFRSNIRFPFSGIYTFKLTQGMRNNNLPGVISVGLTVETHKSN